MSLVLVARGPHAAFWLAGCVLLFALVWSLTSTKWRAEAIAARTIAELRESDERYRAVFDTAGDALALVDPADGRILDANPAAARLYGYSREEMLTLALRALSTDPDATEQALAVGDIVVPLQYQRRKDGTVFPAEETLTRAVLRGRPLVTVAARDISARIRAEQAETALRESEARFRRLAENVPDVIYRYRFDPAVIEYLSPAFEAITGFSTQEFCADVARLVQHVHPDDQARMLALLRDRTREGVPVVLRFLRRDGSVIWAELRDRSVRGAAGEVVGLEGVARDITAQRQAEVRLQQAQKLESLGALAGGLAHDFNNLLTAILGNTALLLMDRPAGSPDRAALETIEQAAHRASDLTRHMLAYAGGGRWVLTRRDLGLLARDVVDEAVPAAPAGVRIAFATASGLTVRADEDQVRLAVRNLVRNAVEAVAAGGDVTVRLTRRLLDRRFLSDAIVDPPPAEGDYAVLEVEDTGPGMDTETRQRAIEPFFSTKFIGRGLGLPAVLGIARGHGGTLLLDSEPGRGTRVLLALPVAEPVRAHPTTTPAATSAPSRGGQPLSVLLVEGEPAVRRVAQRALERDGFVVLGAASDKEALDRLADQGDRIDAVVLDAQLLGPAGEAMFARIRRARPSLPVLLASGFEMAWEAGAVAGDPAVAVLAKPFTPAVLTEALRALIARARRDDRGAAVH